MALYGGLENQDRSLERERKEAVVVVVNVGIGSVWWTGGELWS